MTKKKSKPTTPQQPASRTVFEVVSPEGQHQIDAEGVTDLIAKLAKIWPIDEYSIKGAASLALTQKATITGKGWSIKRLGTLAFVADDDDQAQASTGQRVAQPQAPKQAQKPKTEQPTQPEPPLPPSPVNLTQEGDQGQQQGSSDQPPLLSDHKPETEVQSSF